MISFAINHVTVANAGFTDLLEIASDLGCAGVEVRNDLRAELFDGMQSSDVPALMQAKSLRLLALAELKSFNNFTDTKLSKAQQLIETATSCGAEAISLIPCNDGALTDAGARKAALKLALAELHPLLKAAGIKGFVEPLGFASSSLRSKQEAVDVIEALDAGNEYKLVHDTFHHFLAGETEFFPQHTGIVHVSGVDAPAISIEQMQDRHRVLVGSNDRLRNRQQVAALCSGGYRGPVSMEAFASEVHQFTNPASKLRESFDFINSDLAAYAA